MSVEQADVRFSAPAPRGGRISERWVTQLSKIAVTQFQDQTQSMRKRALSRGDAQISGNPSPSLRDEKEDAELHAEGGETRFDE